jgi:hypothetical protein
MSSPTPGPDASIADKIKWLYEDLEDPSKENELETDVEKLDIKDKDKDEEVSLEEQIRRDFLSSGPRVKKDKKTDQDAVSRFGV